MGIVAVAGVHPGTPPHGLVERVFLGVELDLHGVVAIVVHGNKHGLNGT